MEIQKFTADLFTPAIAWDTTKRHVAEQLTAKECAALIKRSTYNLRYHSPEIRRSLDNLTSIRQRYAKLYFTQELIKLNLVDENGVEQYKRMARIADAQFKSTSKTMVQFQRESAYRLCCMIKLAGLETDPDIKKLYEDLDALAGQQALLDNASLLSEIIHVCVKRGAKYPEYENSDRNTEFKKMMSRHTHDLQAMLERRVTTIEGKQVADYLDAQYSKQPVMNDSIHTANTTFQIVRTCFEQLNQFLLSQLSASVLPLFDQYPDFRMNRA